MYSPQTFFNTNVEMPVENLQIDGDGTVFMRCSPLCTECGAACENSLNLHIFSSYAPLPLDSRMPDGAALGLTLCNLKQRQAHWLASLFRIARREGDGLRAGGNDFSVLFKFKRLGEREYESCYQF
jgi:hypothetical protein